MSVLPLAFSCGGTQTQKTGDTSNPSAPTGLTLNDASETSLVFKWNNMEGATGYEWLLTRGGATVQSGSVTGQRYVDITGLHKATTYLFQVLSIGQDGYKSAASSLEATTLGVNQDPPAPPTPDSISYADFLIPSVEEDGPACAFPGAEGGGMWTTGGRGGSVYHVTTLEDSSSNPAMGTLRYGIEKAGRPLTIVFDVAGIIELQKQLTITKGDLTIAGQTAPGDGICLKNYTLRLDTGNIIIRYIRCRMGDECKTADDAMTLYTKSDNYADVIIDHCSLSWSTDECGSFYGMKNFTLSWCILSEGLRNSVHNKGKHGYGGLWGGENATYHHNLLAHHDSRNPRLDHDYLSLLKGPVSLVNNVIYNWGDNSTYGGESTNDNGIYRKYNIINNYYKPGPATAASGKIRIIDPWFKACDNCTERTGCSTIVPGHYYMSGNVMHGNSAVSADNWKGTTASQEQIETIRESTPFAYPSKPSSLTVHSAQDAFQAVLGYCGASLRRDSVDERIAREANEGTYKAKGSNGSDKGLIDTQVDVGGWPEYKATPSEESLTSDIDGDGIPDWFEDAAGLGKSDSSDGSKKTLDIKGRYTNLEMYLHYLVRETNSAQNQGGTYSIL